MKYLIDLIKDFEEKRGTLEQLLLVSSAAAPSSLQVQALVSLIDTDLADDPKEREPKKVIVKTCAHLIQILQAVYGKCHDTMGVSALQRALSIRIPKLPSKRRNNIDGCTTCLTPPDTSDILSPQAVAKDVQDFFCNAKKAGLYRRDNFRKNGELMTVEELREEVDESRFLDVALMIMYDDYSFEDCLDAFFPIDEYPVDLVEWIEDFEECYDGGNAESRDRTKVCAFAGIAQSLREHELYLEEVQKMEDPNSVGEFVEEFEEEEPEMYHGWTGSWDVNEGKPKKNDIFYGVRPGTILRHAEEKAKTLVKKPKTASPYSLPYARFHEISYEEKNLYPKAANEAATPQDIAMCRARTRYIEDETFLEGDDGAYSSKQWSHDGNIGFSHTGGGWKNREFNGYLYDIDLAVDDEEDDNVIFVRGFRSKNFSNEFWSTPSEILANSPNDTVWIHADDRIKGFSIDRSPGATRSFYTSYIFNVLNKSQAVEAADMSQSTPGNKRRKVKGMKKGNQNNDGFGELLVFGSRRIGYLCNGLLQEWELDALNRHDGVRRMIHLESVEEDIAQWNEDDILNLSEGTWMDECGKAEATIGKKPNSIRFVDISTPSSVGYLPGERLCFAHEGSSQIPIYDHELRETSRLVGFGGERIEIVQRPTFGRSEEASNTFVASDSSCVKIFDLRSGKAEITILLCIWVVQSLYATSFMGGRVQ